MSVFGGKMKKLIKIILIVLFFPISIPILVGKSKLPKILKIVFFVLYFGFFAIILLTPSKYTPEERAATKTAIVALTPTDTNVPVPTETTTPTETLIPTTIIPSATNLPETKTTEKPKIEEPILKSIMIDGEQLGEYVKYVTLNADTDMPNRYVAYFVPAGVYKVESFDQPWSQVNVYSSQTQIVDGWEEPAEASSILVKYAEIEEIEVKEGFYVKVVPQSHVNLYRIK